MSHDHKFVYINPSFTSALGYEAHQLLHTHILTNIHPDDVDAIKQKLANEQATGFYRYRHRSGLWRWLESSARWFTTSSGELRAVVISRDITDRKIAEEQLKRSKEDLRKLSEHLEHTLEEERKRISRELHDDIGQQVIILKFDLSSLATFARRAGGAVVEKIENVLTSVDNVLQSIRQVSSQLRPAQLDVLGLAGAIRWDTESYAKKTGLAIDVHIDPSDLTLDLDRSVAVYKVFREAVMNVVRHSGASKVWIELLKRGDIILLSIRDNGRGITPGEIEDPLSLGLIGMRERIRRFNGKLMIEAGGGVGTTLKAWLPQS